ncbi:hypothetical protein K435DRAFT_851046 [Dendrothele bispora CBS 962.96]|uniref:Uncharacterized protein n=1 Tax=Dendrothele bispora (strain CBS 962.96) TaxID=1314807 RepID=A0A4S8MMT9_DENBC|nr:hypothetical protein K435DRAFT_851046 [Dendrothele bispora CBS 962.96]
MSTSFQCQWVQYESPDYDIVPKPFIAGYLARWTTVPLRSRNLFHEEVIPTSSPQFNPPPRNPDCFTYPSPRNALSSPEKQPAQSSDRCDGDACVCDMAPTQSFPGDPGFTVRSFRARVHQVLDLYVPASEFLSLLVSARGVIIGSVARHVAHDTIPPSPSGLDVAIAHEGLSLISSFLLGKGYQRSDDTVIAPWRTTAQAVYHFQNRSRRRFGPSSATDYVRVVQLCPIPHALYVHLLKSPTTADMTFLSPSVWVTFYPELWSDRLQRNGISVISSNTDCNTPCHNCPASNRGFSDSVGFRFVLYSIPRSRADIYGQQALSNFKNVPIKWRFSVHCFNVSCPRYFPWLIRRPDVFFAPASDEIVESLTDDMCMFKESWISRCGLRCNLGVLMRPDTPPNLVPVPLEPLATHFSSLDSVMAELWIPRPDSVVWTMENLRLTKLIDEATKVKYTLYIQPHDRSDIDEDNHSHIYPMLLLKHTDHEMLSFTTEELDNVKRTVYEWLDPTLEESDDIYVGHSDWYVDTDEI